jgi:hypothetical protein
MNQKEALEAAIAAAARNEDGQFDAEIVAKEAAFLMDDPDIEEIKIQKMKLALRGRTSPGQTEANGQLFSTYPYEPDRLVADDHGNMVEQSLSKPGAKQAEARRAMRNAVNVTLRAQRKNEETSLYSEWATNQVRSGAEWATVTFDRFVRGEGHWTADEIEDPIAPSGDDEF